MLPVWRIRVASTRPPLAACDVPRHSCRRGRRGARAPGRPARPLRGRGTCFGSRPRAAASPEPAARRHRRCLAARGCVACWLGFAWCTVWLPGALRRCLAARGCARDLCLVLCVAASMCVCKLSLLVGAGIQARLVLLKYPYAEVLHAACYSSASPLVVSLFLCCSGRPGVGDHSNLFSLCSINATCSCSLFPAVADQVRATITGRQQRQRKQSRWLQETFDPNAGKQGKCSCAVLESTKDVQQGGAAGCNSVRSERRQALGNWLFSWPLRLRSKCCCRQWGASPGQQQCTCWPTAAAFRHTWPTAQHLISSSIPRAVLGGKPLVERQFEEDNARGALGSCRLLLLYCMLSSALGCLQGC